MMVGNQTERRTDKQIDKQADMGTTQTKQRINKEANLQTCQQELLPCPSQLQEAGTSTQIYLLT